MNINRARTSCMVMTLCPRCLSFYINHPNDYDVERLTEWNGPKSICTKCNYLGYDYRITDKWG